MYVYLLLLGGGTLSCLPGTLPGAPGGMDDDPGCRLLKLKKKCQLSKYCYPEKSPLHLPRDEINNFSSFFSQKGNSLNIVLYTVYDNVTCCC